MSDASTELHTADLYDGAYGPTLRLGAPSDHHLAVLREILCDLALGRTSRVALESEARFLLTGASSVQLVLSSEAERKKTVSVEGRDSTRRVEWKATRAQWNLCAELLEGFTVGRPGHQYLSTEDIDDALIEVVYLEGPSRTRAKPNTSGLDS